MAPPTPLASPLLVLRGLGQQPNFRNWGLGYLGFNLTEFASWILILLYAYERGGVVESGIVAAVMLLVSLVGLPAASRVGTRLRPAAVLAVGYFLMSLSCVGCAVALAAGASGWAVYAAMLALCIGITFSRPLQMATLVSITGTAEGLTAGNVLSGLVESASYFAGPLLAAVLLPSFGAETVFGVLAISMGSSVYFALSIEGDVFGAAEATGATGATEAGEENEAPRSIWKDYSESFRAVLGEPDLRVLVRVSTVHEIHVGAVDVLFVAIAFELLSTGDSGAAILNSAFGLGLIGGALVSMNFVGSRRMGIWLLAGGFLAGLPLVMLSGISAQAGAGILFGISGIGSMLAEVSTRTLLQRVIPPARIAQTFGVIETISLLAVSVGSLLVAVLIHVFGIAPTLVTLGVGLAVVIGFAFPSIRKIESLYTPPDAGLIEALRALPLFQPLGGLAMEQLARSTERAAYDEGTVLIRQGDHGGAFYVLLEGKVEACIDGVRVREQGAGECFGEISALRGIPRTATVRVLEPVVVLQIDPDRFVEAVSSHPGSLARAGGLVRRRLGNAAPEA